MKDYLDNTSVINWQHPAIRQLAANLAQGQNTPTAIAQRCFVWVRDEVKHSADYQLNPVTWRASDVLHHRTGYCFAKSHLLAALLRAHQIPAGFCYQRLSINDDGAPYSLHGFNAVHLAPWGWYRLDCRGNKPRVEAQFSPPHEQLAYSTILPGEMDFKTVLAEPLTMVVQALQAYSDWKVVRQQLPDITPAMASQLGLEIV
ncbi:MAG: transglutaminase family protein [Leptolyngbyaceae cyanobacterium]